MSMDTDNILAKLDGSNKPSPSNSIIINQSPKSLHSIQNNSKISNRDNEIKENQISNENSVKIKYNYLITLEINRIRITL